MIISATPTPPLSSDSPGPTEAQVEAALDAEMRYDHNLPWSQFSGRSGAEPKRKRMRAILSAARTPSAPIAAPVRDDGALEAPEACLDVSRRKLARITGAWEAKANLDDGDICFLIRMAGQRLATPTPPLSPDSTGPAELDLGEPVVWVVPGDDTANCNGYVDAMCIQEGEFTRPLYAAPQIRTARTPSAPLAAPVRDDGARGCWSGPSAAEVVRRTRCEASAYNDDLSGRNTWRQCCDVILSRLASLPAPAGDVPGEAQTEAPSGWKNEHCNGEPEADKTGAVLVSGALADIAAERRQQVEVEGWTIQHDDEHADGELALAAACYALCSKFGEEGDTTPPIQYPWARKFWKVKTERKMLVIAGSLVVAAIDKLDRSTSKIGEVL